MLSFVVVLQGKWSLSTRKVIIVSLVYGRRAHTGALHVNARRVSSWFACGFLISFRWRDIVLKTTDLPSTLYA